MIHILSWIAIFVLAYGQISQIWRIHVHKEVRDLSPALFISWVIGDFILFLEAVAVGSPVFAFKNLLMMSLLSVTVFQIWYHRKDHWHDESDLPCGNCGGELEPEWIICPYCATNTPV